jgi:hypothetical protein
MPLISYVPTDIPFMSADRFYAIPLPFGAAPPGRWILLFAFIAMLGSGCSLFPDIKHKPQYHNPFPQLTRIAILPFRNQSQEPTLSGARVTAAYHAELQAIPGFEVLPVGVVENQWIAFESQILRRPASTTDDFQRFAQFLGVDAVLQGAVTDYTPYYPPRMTLKVNWYASNPGFHPIPAGYGLPWGTKDEKKIPQWVRLESERSLAREQLKTQVPDLSEAALGEAALPTGATPPGETNPTSPVEDSTVTSAAFAQLPTQEESEVLGGEPLPLPAKADSIQAEGMFFGEESLQPEGLPANWPDPEGFIPHPPRVNRPPLIAQYEPIISYMKAYNGSDEDFTESLEEYFYFRDDARFGGWQAYLQRSEDFIRFCCHRHVVETLAARGGQLESRLILRWPIGRYER